MEQQIKMYDVNNNQVGMTFKRRAKQLVNKRRAIWLDETNTAIRLLPELKEEHKLDKEFLKQTNGGYEIVHDGGSGDLYDKESLRCLAEKRVKEKRNLLRHIAICIPSCILLLFYSASKSPYDFLEGFVLGIILTWVVFLLRHIAIYFYSRLKGSNILKSFSQDPVEIEYEKLKNMEPDKIAMEYKRL